MLACLGGIVKVRPKQFMKKHFYLAVVSLVALQGCVAIPPLIQVQHHKDDNSDLARRLDSIERRLERLEHGSGNGAEKK